MSLHTQLSNTQLREIYLGHVARGYLQEHLKHIQTDLRDLGADQYDLWLPETHSLPMLVQPDERIIGIVYGRYKQAIGSVVGRGALVATERRVLLIDKKPLFVSCDEISYHVVSAISYTKAGLAGTVVLHTRMGDVSIRTFNQSCARGFVAAIEAMIFKKERESE